MASLSGKPLAFIVIFVLVVGLGRSALRRRRGRQVTPREEAVTDQASSLRYEVPVGQDPAAVVAALKLNGYEVVRDDAPMRTQDLIIMCPGGADRERARVRAVIAHEAPIDMEGHAMPEHEVLFTDER